MKLGRRSNQRPEWLRNRWNSAISAVRSLTFVHSALTRFRYTTGHMVLFFRVTTTLKLRDCLSGVFNSVRNSFANSLSNGIVAYFSPRSARHRFSTVGYFLLASPVSNEAIRFCTNLENTASVIPSPSRIIQHARIVHIKICCCATDNPGNF